MRAAAPHPHVLLAEVIAKRTGSVDPSKFPDETFELLSIPAFDAGKPEILKGSEIGSSKQIVQAGDVLLSKIVPHIRRSWVVRPKTNHRLIASGEWIVFRNDNFDSGYLRHLLVSDAFHAEFMRTVSGVGGSLLRARPAEVAKISIPQPSPEEQKRIAAILDKADSLRRKRQQAIRLADDFLRAVFLDMFGDLQVNPKGWDSVPLGELIQEGPTNGLYCPSGMYGSGTPILRIDGFYDGRLLPDYQFKRVRIDEKTQERYCLKENSIVVNRVNSREFVGKAAYVGKLTEPTVFESNMMNLTLNPERADQVFIVEQMRMPYIRAQIATARKDAVNQSSVNQDDIRNLTVRLPPVDRQTAFRKAYEKHGELRKLFKPSSLEADAAIKALQVSYLT